MKNKQKLFADFENTVFKIQHLVDKRLIKEANIDILLLIKQGMVRELSDLIFEKKKDFIVERPLDESDMSRILDLLIHQETEFSLELFVLTRKEFKLYTHALIAALTYEQIKDIKKEIRKWPI